MRGSRATAFNARARLLRHSMGSCSYALGFTSSAVVKNSGCSRRHGCTHLTAPDRDATAVKTTSASPCHSIACSRKQALRSAKSFAKALLRRSSSGKCINALGHMHTSFSASWLFWSSSSATISAARASEHTAARMTSSVHILRCTISSARGHSRTAVLTNSASCCKLSAACRKAKPFLRTASNTMLLSDRSSLDAIASARPLDALTAASTIA
mmetsp:Transcript_15776/g.35399  ORF Transcript_15776/g.35399 Transcript_15776/m.35399 type:complete len:213 (+) Transcript_15776:181-819(+)